MLDTLLPPVPLDFINFSKNCDFSNFSQFLEKSQKFQKSHFWLDTLVPAVTLDLIHHKQGVQSVVLEGEHSHSVPVTSDVPQGSVLGPLMFLMFINDLPCYVKSRVRLFSDDTVIYLTIKSESDCPQLQDDLHSLEKWECDWCTEFNPSKCNVIRVTRRRTPFKFQYKLHRKVLETVDTTKYLGINLSHDLRWNGHVNAITTKANKTLNFLRRNLRTCSAKSKEQAFKALVRRIVEYSAITD